MEERVENRRQQLIKLTSDFCNKYLDDEYKNLCEKLILKMSRKRKVPFMTGRIEIWAAAVIYALGQINFLFDKSFEPYVAPRDICNYFGTKQSTVSQKAKYIRDMFKMWYWDDEFSTNRMKEDNPFSNLIMLKNGLIVDVDTLASIMDKTISEEKTHKKPNNKQKCLKD